MEGKKLTIIYILKILHENTDVNHRLTCQEIVSKLDASYGIEVDRKLVMSDISLLNEFGFEIKSTHTGYYLSSRKFSDGEIQLLMDSVMFSKHISKDQANKLIKKLGSLTNKHFNSTTLKSVYNSDTLFHADTQEIFKTIDIINKAIKDDCQIKFKYCEYLEDKKLHEKYNGESRLVNPYKLIALNSNYYLDANIDEEDYVRHFRIDKIKDIEILSDSSRKPLSSLNTKVLTFSEYVSTHPFMFTGEPERIVFKTKNKGIISHLIDSFGTNFKITKNETDTLTFELRCNLSDIYIWILGYGSDIEVIYPESLRNKIKSTVMEMVNLYKENE